MTEEEHGNTPYTSPQATPVGDHDSTEETDHVQPTVRTTTEEQPREDAHSSLRASPLGSVLDAVTDTNVTYSTPAAPPSVHEITSSTQRHSPAGSVHSSSLFSSGLPSPIMSPRGRSQSDTVASRGSPLGSIHVQTQPPLRPQSLGASVSLSETVPISVEILTIGNSASHLESRRGPMPGAEGPSISPVLRQSPTGSNHSTNVQPRGGSSHADDASRHSSQRGTPVLSVHSEPQVGTSPFVAPQRPPNFSHGDSGNSTRPLHDSTLRALGAGSDTELSMETVYRQDTDTAADVSRNGPTAATPLMSPTDSRESQRESENSAPSVRSPRHRTCGAGNPERAFTQGTPTVVSRNGSSAAASPVMPSRNSRVSHGESESSTRHRTSGTGNPSELLAESYRRGSPPVLSHSAPIRASRGQSPAPSFRSRAEHSSRRVLSPPLSHESVIPSRGSAFATVNGERGSSTLELSSEMEALREERDTLANELRQRAAHYEAELRRVKTRNEDLEQQMLSIEVITLHYIHYLTAPSTGLFRANLQASYLWVRSDISIYRRRWQPLSVH